MGSVEQIAVLVIIGAKTSREVKITIRKNFP